MRWPSDNLLQQLRNLKLCSKADVEACEPIVRRLCHDLPDFDSVWLDALVQRKTLTPWQASQLLAGNPNAILVDDIRLRDSCGAHTWIGELNQQTVSVRQVIGPHQQSIIRQLDLLRRQLSDLDEVRHSAPGSICLPDHLVEAEDTNPSIVSNHVSGWTADELIVRGGRLPWQAVAEIGLQMLEALNWLDSHGWTHGEVTLRNIRISSNGQATLVAPFVKQLQQPTVSITGAQTLKEVETTAPELVGTGRTTDARSELYSLGCVLWQLLTARPPFASADPVARLQQGQVQEIVNVRQLVPECPEWLASRLYSLTRRSPALRPASISIAAKEWAAKVSHGTTATRRLLKRLPDRLQRQQLARPQRQITSRLSKLAVVSVMIPVFGLYAWQRGLLPTTLELKRSESTVQASETSTESTEPIADDSITEVEPRVLSLPVPDAAGVVLLRSGKEYHATDLRFAGVMHIETDGQQPAIVNVASESWNLQASHVDISNLMIRVSASDGSAPQPPFLINVASDVLSLRECIVQHPAGDANGAGVFWESTGTTAGVIKIRNCVFRGRGYGVWSKGTPSRLQLDNVLLAQQAGGVRVDSSQSPLRLSLSQVTQVGGHSFVDVIPNRDHKGPFLVQMQCGESVLAPSTGLIRIAATESMKLKDAQVEFLLPERGNATIIPPEVDPVLCFDRSLGQFVKLTEEQIVSESLLIAKPLFRGAENPDHLYASQQFELLDYEGPKLSSQMPGISVTNLPRILSEVHN